ncbi:hypothetical protein [Treponema sp. UBA3813]|uniref:hypothetical protein n=1 Tax=Treponema sp. UBA3813 TaxID=1947715 RepID=UPI0025E52C74|nr:hypothetical protein [Treponema sp. UBA3813]
MIDNKKIYLYIATNLALLIPVPGRFAYALILLVIFNIQTACMTLIFHGIYHVNLANMRNAILSLAVIAITIFCKQLLVIFCPVAALTLGYCIFLPALASVIIEFFFLNYDYGLKNHLRSNMKKSYFITLFALVFFLIRDIFGYGTLTFPGWKHLIVIHFPYNTNSAYASSFIATIPGSLVLISALLALYIFLLRKLRIFANSPVNHFGEELR